MTTYVYDHFEVRKTGREARKLLRSGNFDVLFEITPIDSKVGVWYKWVRETDLFYIDPSKKGTSE